MLGHLDREGEDENRSTYVFIKRPFIFVGEWI